VEIKDREKCKGEDERKQTAGNNPTNAQLVFRSGPKQGKTRCVMNRGGIHGRKYAGETKKKWVSKEPIVKEKINWNLYLNVWGSPGGCAAPSEGVEGKGQVWD